MKKHLLKLIVYYIILNILALFLILSGLLVRGIVDDDGVYECEDSAFHVHDCSFGEFLVENIFWIGFGLIVTTPVVQPILVLSSLMAYYILNFLSKKFERVNKSNFFINFLIFFCISLMIACFVIFIALSFFTDTPIYP